MDPWVWLGFSIFVGYGIAAITGFGSVVIALSLGALVLPIDIMLPVLVPLNVCMTGYLVLRHYRHIHWPSLLKLILPFMLLGMAGGYWLRPWLADTTLLLIFGVLVVAFAARELWHAFRSAEPPPHGRLWSQLWMVMAGVVHGLFASGGPLLVYSITGIQLKKSQFRATLTTVWLSLNSVLVVAFALDGSLAPAALHIVTLLPALLAGVLVGEYFHHRVNEDLFKRLVFALLFVTGCLLIYSATK